MLTSRRAVLAAGLLAGGCLATTEAPRPGSAGTPLAPMRLTGPLRNLGGFEIDNARLGAGGLSGLHLDDDLLATMIDDRGRWAQARIVLRDGQAEALEPVASGPLGDGAGQPLPPGHAGDAEALARLPDGTWLVGFERWHRIRAYRRLDGAGTYVEAPPGLDRSPFNAGLESLGVLADGRLLAISEGLAPDGAPALRSAWIGGPGRWDRLAWRPAPGLVPVDAAGLPDGGALVLERGFSWLGGFTGRLVSVPADAIRAAAADTVLEGEEILRFDGSTVPAENYEGVAAVRHGGRTLVAIVADDNHSPLQRSLLLLFELRAPAIAAPLAVRA
ncbi:esterase-like activity of phytase family protein [Neoroseomonas soli]|uniref:Esterase-like activity of phytase family protein n=1 Tax=Neoroseomonas soli TaxID=1081025 RepID=A0A9X9X2H7_9PROT|nr:esterase-like activity of phytase family protein [Neoroseomonas soli]MBR0673606.1 esterase-like activity of phytase family protein [Neoroseomonas soli]